MAEFVASAAGERRVVVVNTHHHWDHVFGNAAFAGVDIVAQRGCPRLIQAELQSGDESLRLPPPEGVPLPNVTFGDRLTYSDDGRVGAPHPHARPQRGLAGGVPHRAPAAARRRHGGVAAAQLRPARRRATTWVQHAAPAQAAAGRPRRARRTGRRWTSRSSTPTSATSPACTRPSPRPRPAAPARGELDLPRGALPRRRRRRRRRVRRRRTATNLLWAWDEV